MSHFLLHSAPQNMLMSTCRLVAFPPLHDIQVVTKYLKKYFKNNRLNACVCGIYFVSL